MVRLILFGSLAGCLLFASKASGQYVGVTCGWQYSAQLSGPPTYPTHKNISLYNPTSSNSDATWDSWAEQLAQAGVDFVCPNCTGSWPNTNNPPSQMAPLLTALINRGLTNQIKFAIFDDDAASWCAQWNQANGRGFDYALPMDLADTNNWKYLYDYNYKIFYQTIPDANRFKVNGRPLIIFWAAGNTFCTNQQGNLSRALMYVRQKCQADFGFNPYIVANQGDFNNDTTINDTNVIDATQAWFGPPNTPFTLTTFKGRRTGVAAAAFGVNNDMPANHGQVFDEALSSTVGSGALLTLCEGFTDYEEGGAMCRVRNLDTNGASLDDTNTAYEL